MKQSHIIDEVWIKSNSEELFLELYFIGQAITFHYSRQIFTEVDHAELTSDFIKAFNIPTPLCIEEVREHEDLDNIFIFTNSGDIIRTNIKDFQGGSIFEELTYERFSSDPTSFYQELLKWFEEAAVVWGGNEKHDL